MLDTELIRRKLVSLQGYLKELKQLSDISFEEYERDFTKRRAIERLIQLIVETASDINAHVVTEETGTPPKDYYSSFVRAADSGLISRNLAERLAPSAGLRNRLVHEYEALRDEIVFESIQHAIIDYVDFVQEVENFLEAKHA
ncbi:MAG: type VII toxin-antitoxin system HepT family RNase toxin [Candidatus Aquicultor sp.]